ncbi:unnamed protein product, partial [Amoebophrya sp. A25]
MVAPTHEVWTAFTKREQEELLNIVYVQDYFPLGDLHSFVNSKGLRRFYEDIKSRSEFEAASFWFHLFNGFTRDLVVAVSTLHTLGYAHRGIKPESILVEQDEGRAGTRYKLRLTGFDYALRTNRKKEENTGGEWWSEDKAQYEGTQSRWSDPILILADLAGDKIVSWKLNVFHSDAWAVG